MLSLGYAIWQFVLAQVSSALGENSMEISSFRGIVPCDRKTKYRQTPNATSLLLVVRICRNFDILEPV